MSEAQSTYRIEQSIGTYYGEGQYIRFFAIEDGVKIGGMWIDADRHIIMQIEVDEDRRGEGIATALYEAADAEVEDLMHAPGAACTPEGLAFSQAIGGERADDMDELADYHDAMAE